MRQGDRVTTKLGTGTVVYVRMAPPDFREIEAVSVKLDSPSGSASVGTIFKAADVVLGTVAPTDKPDLFYRGKQGRGSIHD